MSPVVAELVELVKIDASHQLCATLTVKSGVKLVCIYNIHIKFDHL